MKRTLCLGCLLALPLAARTADAPRPRHVLLIAVDDLRPALGCYGDARARTPHIDALAADGALFRRAYCQQAVSGPTRASLLTGLRPEEVGVTELNTWIREADADVVTLPQAFRQAGYRTQSVGKIFHGTKNSLDRPSWSRPPLLYAYSRNEEYQLPENKTGRKAAAAEFADAPDSLYFDVRIRDEALKQIEELGRSEEPFFLAVGFLKPHLPFCAPRRYWEACAGGDFAIASTDRPRPENAPSIAYHNSEELRGYTDIPDLGPLSPEQEAALRRAYYACVAFTDELIGSLIGRLKQLGLYDDTLIVLWGDHGYHLGEQELWCKSTTYEAACRAPLIVKPAGRPQPRTVDDVVEFLDIFPTMLDLCSIGPCPQQRLSGRTLRPLLEGRRTGRHRYAVSQFQRPYPALTSRKKRRHTGYVIRDERWSYTEWVDLQGRITARELYDLSAESGERCNLAGTGARRSVCRRMARALHRVLNNQQLPETTTDPKTEKSANP